MSVDYFNANVYSAAAPGGACCVGLLFGPQPTFQWVIVFWSVCAEGLLIGVPDGTKTAWVWASWWVGGCVRERCVSVWFVVLCFCFLLFFFYGVL